MKNNFKKVFNKYLSLKNYFLKHLQFRKQKVKHIWQKANSLKKYKLTKTNNKNKFKNFFSKIHILKNNLFNKFKFSNGISNKKLKTVAQTKLLNKSQKTDKKSYKENTYQKYKIFPEKLYKIFIKSNLSKKYKEFVEILNKKFFKSNFSKIDLTNIESLLDKYLSEEISKSFKSFYKDNFNKNSDNKSILFNFLGVYYANNKLTITHLQRKNNKNIIKDFVQIDAPGDLIGEYKIEKISEVTRIINDVIKIFELKNPPVILFLASSFFTTRSFNDAELVIFSDEDPLILSKSPFLPDETLIQYKRVNGDKNSSYHRVIYANKEVIDSWINSISLTGCEIATVTCPSIHIIENLNNNTNDEISVLCDIEDFITTVYVVRNKCELFSSRLPFGSSFYITGQESLNDQFFSRLRNSVRLIISDNNLESNDNIYLTGNGLDKMLSTNNIISDGFTKIPINKFKFEKEKESNLNNESIFSYFSKALDILIQKEVIKKKVDKNQQIYRGQKYKQNEENKEEIEKKTNSLTYRGKNYKG